MTMRLLRTWRVALPGGLLLAVLLLAGIRPLSAAQPPGRDQAVAREVADAAQEGLQPLLASIPKEDLQYYGFATRQELLEARLGTPFHVYTIRPTDVLGWDARTELSSVVAPTEMWFFPVLYGSEARTLLTVDFHEGSYRAVAVGDSPLARELAAVQAQWPEKAGRSHQLVRIFQAMSDIVIVTDAKGQRVVPLANAMQAIRAFQGTGPLALRALGVDERAHGSFTASEVIPALAPAVAASLRGGPNGH